MKKIVLLGSTGSIGVNALDVVDRLNGSGPRFRVAALTAHRNVELLKRQIRRFRPELAVVGGPEEADHLRTWARRRRLRLDVRQGPEGLVRAAAWPGVSVVVSAVVGSVGLHPLLAALERGRDVALANKEALIVAGEVVMDAARRRRARVIPVDSEHSAIFQCLGGTSGRLGSDVRRLILTASGGAFYRHRGPLSQVRVDQALRHPTWKMGRKITIDCATLTNKGLEAIEAHHLFGVPMDKIDIVIHPQSIVHSLVEFNDGSMLAQLSHPDMRLPIQYALTFPERCPTPVAPLRLEEIKSLEFFPPNFRRFPSLGLALEAGRRGGTWPAVFNGANERAVQAFIDGRILFTDIPRLCRRVMEAFRPSFAGGPGLQGVEAADRWSRRKADEWLKGR